MRTVVILLLCALPAAGQSFFRSLLAEPDPVAAGGAGPTYLLEQDMEGLGTPSGWTDVGTVDWDYLVAPIVGTQSWQAGTGTGNNSTSPSFTAPSVCYAFFALTVGAGSGNIPIFLLRNGTTTIASFDYRSTSVFRISHGSANSATFSGGAGTYYVWLDYTAGTGLDGVMNCYIAATQTKPGSPSATLTTGTGTLGADNIRIQGHANSSIIDKIRVDDVDIGSTPP